MTTFESVSYSSLIQLMALKNQLPDGENAWMKQKKCNQCKFNYEHDSKIMMNFSMPIITGALYVRKYFDQASKKNAVDMVRHIKDEFKNILMKLDWMEENTRKSALEKANAVVDHIAYPDELLDDRKLEEVFASVNIAHICCRAYSNFMVSVRSARRSISIFHA